MALQRQAATTEPAQTSQAPRSNLPRRGSGNQALMEQLGLDRGGEGDTATAEESLATTSTDLGQSTASPRPAGTAAAPAGPTTDTPGTHVLARGRDASAGAVAGLRARVEAIVTLWGLKWGAGAVVYTAPAGGDALVTLKWDAAWGDAPTTTDLSATLEPIAAKLAIKALLASAGYAAVPADDQTRLQALLGGETNTSSIAARRVAPPLLVGNKAPAADVTKALCALLTDAKARPDLVDETTAGLVASPYVLSTPKVEKQHQFVGRKADANVYTLTFADNKQVITIYEAAKLGAGMKTHAVAEVADGIAKTPLANRGAIKTVTLNPVVNPDDAYWAVEYKTPNFHSYMTAGAAGEVTIYPSTDAPPTSDYMTSTFIHESAHAWAGKKWGEDRAKGGWVDWKAAMTKDKVSIGNYATSSIDEDVAETVTVYATTKGTPKQAEYRAMVPNRFTILDKDFK